MADGSTTGPALSELVVMGKSVKRVEDPQLITTGGEYVGDVVLPSPPLALAFVRSVIAHARVLSVDVEDARSAEGVVDVVTAADVDLADLKPPFPNINQAMLRPPLARDTVRFVGEPIVAVLAETVEAATDAGEKVLVDFDPLPVVVSPEASLTGDIKLFDEADDNIAFTAVGGETDIDFSGCEVVVTQRTLNQRVSAAPIEGRVAAAYWTGDGRLVFHSSNQGAHPIRDQLAETFGIDKAMVRVISRDVGGSFGSKARLSPEELMVAWLARRAGRPVRWSETRTENLLAMGHGRGQVQNITIGGDRDGRIGAYRIEVVQDAGAYPAMGAMLPFATRLMASGVYKIPSVEFRSRSAVTNTVPTVAYRGAGRPEAIAAVERAVDLFAGAVGVDPAEVRRLNVLPVDAFPYRTATGANYDTGDYTGALDRALAAAGYDDLRREQERRRQQGERSKMLGIGVSTYVEVTAFGGGEYGTVELRPDGGARVLTGSSPYGQGHHTSWSQIVSLRTGIPMNRIEVVHGDTDVVPEGGLTGGSRSVQLAGSSVYEATNRLVELAQQRAADLLEADPADVVLEEGRFHVKGSATPSASWADVAATVGEAEPLRGASDFSQTGATFPFGSHVAVVEVDADTGKATLLRLVACDDAGRLLNPLLAAGQVHGGLAQGAAQALFEEVVYDEDGNPLTTTFADYSIVSAADLPSFERVEMETPTPLNPLGAKGLGESGTIGSTPAVQSAVIDAVRHLGVTHIDMPCTPQRVWDAIQRAQKEGS
jgi:carbon-monoxide dehydrogenase large subunit